MSGLISRPPLASDSTLALPLMRLIHRGQSHGSNDTQDFSPEATLSPNPSQNSISPNSSPQSSPSMSAQVHHADLSSVQHEMNSKMLLNDLQSIVNSEHANESNHQSNSRPMQHLGPNNPLQTLLSAAVPSPSNANLRNRPTQVQALRVNVTSNVSNHVPSMPNQSFKFQPYLEPSPPAPGDSPTFNNFNTMHSPFVGLTSMSPLTGTTASSASIQSHPQALQHTIVIPGSPLSVWSPNIPSNNPVQMMNSSMSTAPIVAQFEGHLNELCRELEYLFPLMAATGPVNSDSMRIVDPDRWVNLAVPLAAEPLKRLTNACRLLMETRKNVLNTSLHVTAVRKNAVHMPPSLMDNEVNSCFSFVCSEAYFRSAQLQSLHSIIKNITAHAYKRAVGIELPNRTTREDDSSNQGQRQCQTCGHETDVSVLFTCNHVTCWSCLGKAMLAEHDSPCSQCNVTWISQRDNAHPDENEALLLGSMYMLSSFSLPSRSPTGSPLLTSFSQPNMLSVNSNIDDSINSSFKKRKVSPNVMQSNSYHSEQQHMLQTIPQSQFHHASSGSAFSRRVGQGSSSPMLPNTSPQFGASSPLPHNPSWSPNIINQSMNYQPPNFSLATLSSFNQLQQQLLDDPNIARPRALSRLFSVNVPHNPMAMNPAQSPTMPYSYVDVHGNVNVQYPSYQQYPTYQNMPSHQYMQNPYQNHPQHPVMQPSYAMQASAVQPISLQDQKRLKQVKPKVEKKSESKKSNVKKEKKSTRRRKDQSSSDNSDSDSGLDVTGKQEADDGLGGLHSGQIYPFLCSFPGCNDSFKTRFSLKRHAKKHSGLKPFVCEYPQCGKQFAEKSTLKRHLRIHTGEKPYQCAVAGCGKMFADRTNVKRHEMIHSGERPYWCNEQGCKRGYFWRKHLRKHLLSVHGIVQETLQGLGNHPEQTLALKGLNHDDEESGPSSAEESEEEEVPKNKKRK